MRPDWEARLSLQHHQIVQPGWNKSMVRPTIDRLRGFTEEMEELGYQASSVVLAQDRLLNRPIAALSRAPPKTPFLRLERVRKANNMAMSHETAWYDLVAVPELATTDGSTSIYEQLRAIGKPLARCEQTIEAVLPSAPQMDAFGFADLVPCLLIRRRSFTSDGQLIEYVEGTFRGDAYALRLQLQAAPTAAQPTFAERFRLTPAEMRVAQAIAECAGRAAAAHQLGIREATLKTHLIHIFQKTGISRQAALVRLMLHYR